MPLRLRKRFPLGQPQLCPQCGSAITIAGDGFIWHCPTCKSVGYYEDDEGNEFPKAKYRDCTGKLTLP